jgi:hypothetical protein
MQLVLPCSCVAHVVASLPLLQPVLQPAVTQLHQLMALFSLSFGLSLQPV